MSESQTAAPLASARPYCVGLTGGIGSGKSLVADCFARRGVGIVDTDVIARELVQPGAPALIEIAAQFGAQVLQNEALDRAALRTVIANDAVARKRLEAILHPRIRQVVVARLAAFANSARPPPYVLLCVPLLVENLAVYRSLIDRILVVDCPLEVQVVRVMARDHCSLGAAQAMLAAQVDRVSRLAVADDVIVNADATPGDIEAEIENLHKAYKKRAVRIAPLF